MPNNHLLLAFSMKVRKENQSQAQVPTGTQLCAKLYTRLHFRMEQVLTHKNSPLNVDSKTSKLISSNKYT